MGADKSLFERLDDISSGQSAILNAVSGVQGRVNNTDDKIAKLEQEINNLKKQSGGNGQQVNINNSQVNNVDLLKHFLSQAKKSWRWFGTKYDFKKSKYLSTILLIALLIVGILEVVVSSICFQMFSTFTLFEGIWVLFGIVYLVNVVKLKQIEETNALKERSTYKYTSDPVGVLYPDKEKLFYRIFRWLAFVSAICNIICVWAGMGKDIKALATIVEVLYLALIVGVFFSVSYLYSGYSIIWVEGNNIYTGEQVVLVLPPGAKQLMTEEEFRKRIPFLFE